jgi:hypothetical protein
VSDTSQLAPASTDEEAVMVVKRVSPGKKIAKRQTVPVAKLKVSRAKAASKTRQSVRAVFTSIDPDVRRQLVAAEAYFLAERRGFVGGNELEDWVAAERVVDSRLEQKQVA